MRVVGLIRSCAFCGEEAPDGEDFSVTLTVKVGRERGQEFAVHFACLSERFHLGSRAALEAGLITKPPT